MYNQGTIVPRDGTVACTQHPNVTKRVKAGERFPPCDDWHQAGTPRGTWRYIN